MLQPIANAIESSSMTDPEISMRLFYCIMAAWGITAVVAAYLDD